MCGVWVCRCVWSLDVRVCVECGCVWVWSVGMKGCGGKDVWCVDV